MYSVVVLVCTLLSYCDSVCMYSDSVSKLTVLCYAD